MRLIKFFIVIIVSLLVPVVAGAQSAVDVTEPPEPTPFPISGMVTDSLSGKAMTYVNVVLKSGGDAMLTDKKGRFEFKNVMPGDSLIITSLGYLKKRVPVSLFASGKRVKIPMSPSTTQLQEVVVTKKKKQKYSKKNNPAVELMERIRASYESHDPHLQPFYNYDKYEKIVLSLNDFHKENAGWLAKRLHPIDDFIDTARTTGLPILNISVRDKASSHISSRVPYRMKDVVKGFRSAGIDQTFDQENIQIMLEDVFRDIDIFGNDIIVMQNRFVSPLSRIAADYYKFFLGDTVVNDGKRFVELIFVPHNPQSFSFNGSLYVDIDSPDPFINRVEMRIPKALNLNFVKNIFVEQTFERDRLGSYHKTSDDMSVELQLISGVQGFYANRHTDYTNFNYQQTADYEPYLMLDGDIATVENFDKRDDEFWRDWRASRVSDKEISVENLSARIDAVPLFKWVRRGIKLLVTGYIPTGNPSKFDIGPVNTMISANTLEGARFRLGGMTTAALSPHWFARGYGAWGTKDHRWKYHAEVEYSFNAKKNHSREWPMHSIRAEHTYDLDMLGQHYLFTNADNIFLSIKRKENILGTYRQRTMLTYFYEHACGLTLSAGIKAERQQGTRYLPFVDGYGISHRRYWQSALFVDVTFAPGAKFVQTASNRLPVNMDNWTFRLTHEYGPKGMFGADFTTNKTEVSVQKRFWFSSFGYLDMIAKGGKVWSRVQYPALPWPNANLSYTIQQESYSLMNPMEFAMDSYLSWDLTYWLNGLIFNRIPYFNELKLREVVNFKGVWGHLSRRNNPEYCDALYRFPEDSHSIAMRDTPYMEISVGIDNILSIIRLDYVWRLSYRNTPGAPNGGLRVALHFSF